MERAPLRVLRARVPETALAATFRDVRLALLALSLLLLAGRATDVEREFKKVERRMYGPDEEIRDACEGAVVEDLATELDRSLEIRKSDVVVRGTKPADLRACVRGVAKTGIVDSWTLEPDGDEFVLRMRLVRARRDPNVIGKRKREKSDREAAAALTKLWEERKPAGETLAPELLAPDLFHLRQARWVAGVVTVEGIAETPIAVAAYRKLVDPLVASGPRVEYAIDVAGDLVPPPPFPETGLLRASLREAPPTAMLRLFAHLDRRDFVLPSGIGSRRTGAIGGGWDGLVAKIAKESDRAALRVGAIDVFAPKGTPQPRPATWDGERITLELEGVRGSHLWTLLAAASGRTITGPDLAPLDVQLRGVAWDQALEAIALAHGCKVTGAAERAVVCPPGVPVAPPPAAVVSSAATVAGTVAQEGPLPPLERAPARDLRVIALGRREASKRWLAIVETPDGFRAVVRDGVVLGREGARAVVEETGVSLLLERADAEGKTHAVAAPLRF